MSGWSGRVSPVIRQKSKGTRPMRNRQRAQARRVVLPGFPIPARAMSYGEIQDYFGADRITCMLCGRTFGRLGVHLPQIHQVTENEYREMYGLPWSYGLVGRESFLRYQAHAKAMMAAGIIKPNNSIGEISKTAPRRPDQPFRSEVAQQNGENSPIPPRMLGVAHFEAVAARVAGGEIVRDILRDLDIAATTWRNFMRANPEMQAVLMRAVDLLPFSLQAANHMGMGPRFVAEVRRLRATGLSDKKIAATLGLTTMTIHGARRKHDIL